MPGKPRREYVSPLRRVEQQREARTRLRRHLKLVPPQPAEVEPEPARRSVIVPSWNTNFQITELGGAEWRNFTSATTTAFTNIGTAFQTIGTAATVSYTQINGNQAGTWGPVTMMPNTIVTSSLARPVRRFYSPEEEAARVQRQSLFEERRQEAHRRRIAAQDRARSTLYEFLNPTQREDYDAHEHFYVEGSAGNLYRIDLGNAGNVFYVDRATRRALASICAHPSMAEHWLPNQDVQLAQKLALEFDEPGFTAIANVHWGIRPPHADLTRQPAIAVPPGARRYVNGPQPVLAA